MCVRRMRQPRTNLGIHHGGELSIAYVNVSVLMQSISMHICLRSGILGCMLILNTRSNYWSGVHAGAHLGEVASKLAA